MMKRFIYLFSILFFSMAYPAFPATADKDTVEVVAVGDIMMGTIVPNGEYLPPNSDCSRSFSMVKQYFGKRYSFILTEEDSQTGINFVLGRLQVCILCVNGLDMFFTILKHSR
jgi:hypothetical protein